MFVCTGNICRSPTAERLAVAYAQQLGATGVSVSSAGVRAVIGHPIHTTAALVLQSLGGDASDFVARQLTPQVAAGADLILTMTAAHRDAVLERTPALLHRTFTMSEAARLATDARATTVHDLSALRSHIPRHELHDIADPIGQDLAVYERIGSQIADMLPPIVDLCRRLETL
ncbi:low molecular weight phosphatase family protein [Mycolicibacterium sp. 018/SC-01/001]|uniref:arsenate reductase/protein-tyrosine-phosphatase family protein n=1 Tax=Mycolicibacterium sp. 018/SC-01/001 TaxID=2592069 RepID=UPI00351AABBC